jgi:hypothetical protein
MVGRMHGSSVDQDIAAGSIAQARHAIDALRRHLVAGQRARLVRADDGDRAEGLDGRQPPYDGVASGHALDPEGDRDGEDRRQFLRNRRHRQADRGEEHLARGLTMHHDSEYEYHCRRSQRGDGKPAAEPPDLAQERGRQRLHLLDHRADHAR